MGVCVHDYMYVDTAVCVCVSVHVFTYMGTLVCACVYVCIFTCVWAPLYVCVYMWVGGCAHDTWRLMSGIIFDCSVTVFSDGLSNKPRAYRTRQFVMWSLVFAFLVWNYRWNATPLDIDVHC